jgi:crotonobetainyl-CoA:carnitine CoA-transferase CaiB-like acyl-CoA transferase
LTLPLENITVVEVSEGVAGAFCGRMLAAFGADVIKIERPPGGDWTRVAEPVLPNVPASEASALHLHLNMGKRSALLDWHTGRGSESLKRLIQGADVLLEDWDTATLDRMGLADGVETLNPHLIDLSLTPFGTSGPYSGWATTPLVSLALGGFLYLSGDEDREPLAIPGRQPEYLAGLHGYSGVMIALWERQRTGRGKRVDITEIETLAALHQFTTVMHTYGGVVRSRHGARWENKGNYGRYPITILPCKDGYVSYAVSTEGQWDLLFPMVGQPELLEDPRFITFVERRDHADDIDAILIDWMRDKTRQEVFEYAAGDWSEPASPLLDLSETLSDAQLKHRNFFTEVGHPDAGPLTYPTVPFRMSATQPQFRPAPQLGQHTDQALNQVSKQIPSSSMGEGQSLPRTRYGGEGEPQNRLADRQIPSPSRERARVRVNPYLPKGKGSLSDLRILDLTRVWAGPLATRILADFGAEVIKISDPRVPIDRMGGTNNKLNRNKPNLALRLDHQSGRDTFLELTATADVVVENFRPRVMRNFNLTYDDLRAVRPDIVMCSMPGYGTTGKYADYPAFGPSVEAMTGLPSMMGYEGGPPRTSSLAFPDPVSALNSVAAIMTALNHRRLTGQGQFIDLALIEGPICQVGEFIAAHSRTGIQPPRVGNAHLDHAPYGVYPVRGQDEWIAICVTSDRQWRELCRLMGRPELSDSDKYADESARRNDLNILDEIIAQWTREQDGAELSESLQSVGIAAGRAAKNYQLLADPHLDARNFFVEIDEPDVGKKTYPGQALRMDGMDRASWIPSARLGEHTEKILSELLAMNDARISQLEQDETIGIFYTDD